MTSTEEQSCLQSAGAESGRIVGPIYYHKKFKQRVGQPAWALDEVTAPSSGDQSAAVEPAPSPSTERRPSADEEDGHEEGAPGGSTAAGPPSLSPCSVGDEACVATVRRSTAAAGRYQCSFCGNFFAKPSVLDKHIRSHTNERPFSCSVCNYSFKTKSNFVKHCKTRKHTARCAGADVDSDEDDDEEPAPSDSDLSDQAEDMDVSWMLARDRPPRTGRALSHSIESIMGRQPPRTRSTSPIVKGVVSHIDKVIELNEAQLSGTRRALDSFGRHSSTLGREREAVRRGSLSSSNSTLDSSEGLTADLCPPPALMRSQSLCASSSGDMTHVLKRHLLSGVNHELAEASSVSKRRRLSIQDSALAVHDAALSAGAPEEHRGRICNSLTGGQMHVYGEAERRASRETQQRAAGGSMSMFVDSRAAHHSYPPSPHIMTIKSNLNSGGKMIEVAGSDAAASGSSISQVGEPRTAASAPPLRHNPFRFPLSSSIVGDSFYPTIRAPNITPQLGPIRLPSRDMSSVCPVRQTRSPAVAKSPHNSTLTSLSKSPLFSPSGSVVSGASTNVLVQHRDNGAAKRKKLTIQIPPPGILRQEATSPTNWHHPSPSLSTPPQLVAFRHAVGHHRPSLVRQSPLEVDLCSQSTNLLSRTNSSSSWPSEPSGTGSSDSLNSSRHPLAIRIQTSHTTAKQRARCPQPTGFEADLVPPSKSSINSSQVSALIPYIPGIPGPCSQGSDTPPRPAAPLRSHPPPLLPLSVTKLNSNCSRPNSLALRPVQYSQDRCGAALYSPETPRPRKTVQQTCLDGQCYTHIRLKSSTRLYFCCMFQTQPNYVQQEGGHRQVSMYSQWRHARPPVDGAPPLSALQLQRPGPGSCSDWCPATGSPPVLMRAGPFSLTALVTAPCRLPRLYGGVPPFQDNTPAVGLTTMTSSGDSDRSSLDIASNTGCNSAILQHPGTYTTAVSDYIRLAGGDESAAAGTRRAVSTAILHTEINSGKLAASGAIDSDGASSSSNSAGCEDDNRPIDLTVRADPTAAAVQQPSAVLSVMNCTEQLTRMYSNLQRISQLVAPSAAAAPPPTATSSRVDKPPPLTPISLSLSSAAIRGGSPVATAVNSPAPSGGQRSSQVQSPRSVVSLLAISSPSGEAAAATPAPTAGPPASCPPPAPTAVAAPFSCPAPPENNMQAVLNDIFNQVRTERASAGMATAGKSGADGPPVADSPTPSTTLSAPSPAAGQQLMHPNVTAGQPGLALTRPGPRSADAEPLQHTDSSFFYRNSDRLVCSVCNKQDFVNRNQLSAHQKTHQMDQRRFRCSVCEIGFRSEQQLAKHRRTNDHMQKSVMLEKFGGKAQTDRRIYECLFCQRGFHNVGTLHKHFRCKTHVMGLENAGWLPCGVYAELESSGISARTDGPDSINVDCTWQNYCHLQELSLALLHDRPAEMSDWRVKFEQIRRGSPPKHYPFEIDSKLRGNTDSSRPRPQFPDDFRGPQLKLEAADSVANLSVQGCQSGLPVQ